MTIEKLMASTPDLARQNIERLLELFPECRTEGSREDSPMVDFDLLRQALSDHLVEGPAERYRLDWPGKRQALLTANTPIDKTLRPMREESVNFDTTRNLFIEGDNLDALKLLQETYLRDIKMIYIDPPYNTGTNLIYKNDFRISDAEYLRESGELDDEGYRLSTSSKNDGRYHSDWLSSFYAPIRLARNLLADNGVLVCTIDENELPSLVLLLREVFGETSKSIDIVSVVHNPRGQQGKNISYVNEFAVFVFPDDGNKYIGDFPKDEVDSRGLRDSGTESDRTDAATCFYPFVVRDGEIVDIGEVPPDDFHPESANVERADGSIEVWPMTDSGDEKKWRYARGSVSKIRDKLEAKMGRNSLQIIFNKDAGTMRSVWAKARYDSSEYGTKLIEELIPGSGFTYPKSLWSVHDTIKAVCEDDPDCMVLDFYAGSGTSGHAVMELNASDGGRRQFALVQIPEKIAESEEPFDRGYKVIADITRQRLKMSGEKILKEKPELRGTLDIGFRAFRIDNGNFVDTSVTPKEATQEALLGMVSHIKNDRSEEDLLFGALLRWGVEITLPIEQRELAGRTVWIVDAPEDGSGQGAALIACFVKPGSSGKGGIDTELADAMAELAPLRVLFRDDGFADDAIKENVHSRFQQRAPDTQVRVL